jgi:hypothetical protein
MKTMTVEQLIAELHKCPPHGVVQTEGCDCYGDVLSVDRSDEKDTWGDFGPKNANVTVVYLKRIA